ncbi:rfaE bifunctional protein [Desulfatibacillum aliphaticivorans]|uniref:Bifunctional protein HldE n=1 Tax=Desulfatibacillum aliphaticivorans TaxID=218208 RepID=HLDE_DESAL|nr:D-glycero-beta-D-manno-heptose-7-phosphate kinase [Desulfatibacillum aliphaticivorans]B8FB71.1 RecName: Full=Bifunctional protein HldE; Includes: RecName: Full=D-beta-D-heptose 7-phosphate kinase; AltName: Full=D-beta-D-heptose 7-phosphotransferase; AltName: Full=D-glycero-beta-D-manno-heptose-7-phosphate kinase; Includes: RecName: Full=D-beta-D-heptose 1-phosphate adenylyltransferase; AltName: Full=D-glycero-beta-D-manno-heptose 1-phosphate adenylyltransferase [Desulfatibacillum aliphaticivora
METENIHSFDVSLFSSCRVLVVGDMMIDEYLWGEVSRISPEAPVQVVEVKKTTSTLGGAGNVVNNLTALGAKVSVAGVMGGGKAGDLLNGKLTALGVNTEGLLVDQGRATTRKTRVIGANQQMLRIDRESKQEISEEQVQAIVRFAQNQIPQCDLVIASDYGKGVLTRSLMEELAKICKTAGKALIVDPKGMDYSKYKGATCITPNKKEASQASGVEIKDQASLERAAAKLLEIAGAEKILITLGKDGMALFSPGEEPFRVHAQARQVFDVSGAGDTVISVLGLSLAAGASYKTAAALANTAAGIVVAKVGTATVDQAELKAQLQDQPIAYQAKLKPLQELKSALENLRRQGKKIILTNGCFDLLHEGHINLLEQSRKLGDVLVVAVDDDESVRMVKGQGRPIIRERERVKIISAMTGVDFVTVFSTNQLDELIRAVKPDILTKGGNYKPDQVLGHEIVEELGGRIVLIPDASDVSSTRIIQDIRNGRG